MMNSVLMDIRPDWILFRKGFEMEKPAVMMLKTVTALIIFQLLFCSGHSAYLL